MKEPAFVLTGDQRDGIIRAAKAIERQLQKTLGPTEWQALFVVRENLTLIQATLENLPVAR